jgi:hypothetical protein
MEILNSEFIGEYAEISELIETIKKNKYHEQANQLRDEEKTVDLLERYRETKKPLITIKTKE